MIRMICSFVTNVGQRKNSYPDRNQTYGLPDNSLETIVTQDEHIVNLFNHLMWFDVLLINLDGGRCCLLLFEAVRLLID